MKIFCVSIGENFCAFAEPAIALQKYREGCEVFTDETMQERVSLETIETALNEQDDVVQPAASSSASTEEVTA